MNAVLNPGLMRDYWNEPMAPGKPSPAQILETLYATHPHLRNAAGVRRPEQASTNCQFDCVTEFAAFVEKTKRGEYRYRVPLKTTDTSNTLIMCRESGDCLNPVFQPNDVHVVDSSTLAQDGDFVIVAWDRDFYNEAINSGRWSNAIRSYGRPGPIATKWLRKVGDRYLLAYAWGGYWLHDSYTKKPSAHVLGVIRQTVRGNFYQYGMPVTNSIGDNAATEIFTASNAGPVSATTVVGAGDISSWFESVTFYCVFDADLELTCNCLLVNNLALGDAYVYARVERLSSPFTVQSELQTVSTIVDASTQIKIPVSVKLNAQLLRGVTYQVGIYITTLDVTMYSNETRAFNLYVSAVVVKR